MRLRPIQLSIPQTIINDFKRQAKASFPKETFAYLLGRDAGTVVDVEELHIPLDVSEHCSRGEVLIPAHWLSEARKEAADTGLKVVGDVHSHPFLCPSQYTPGCAPSETDIDDGMTHIHGICQVWLCKSGLLRTKVRFWGPMIPVKVN